MIQARTIAAVNVTAFFSMLFSIYRYMVGCHWSICWEVFAPLRSLSLPPRHPTCFFLSFHITHLSSRVNCSINIELLVFNFIRLNSGIIPFKTSVVSLSFRLRVRKEMESFLKVVQVFEPISWPMGTALLSSKCVEFPLNKNTMVNNPGKYLTLGWFVLEK